MAMSSLSFFGSLFFDIIGCVAKTAPPPPLPSNIGLVSLYSEKLVVSGSDNSTTPLDSCQDKLADDDDGCGAAIGAACASSVKVDAKIASDKQVDSTNRFDTCNASEKST